MALVTFVIPVRHQDNAADWSRLTRYLSQTISSIASQTSDDWRGVVVANQGAELPPIPPGFQIERVTFPPNTLHQKGSATRDEFLDAFRLDKGQRVLAGMLSVPDTTYFMTVDDDDFVHRDLVTYVAAHPNSTGWMISKGYGWTDGGNFLIELNDFNLKCGTSLIIHSDLYNLPAGVESADRKFVMEMLGSHRGVADLLKQRGTPLVALPFRGAVYRVGNPGSHSRTPGIMRRYVFFPGWKTKPKSVLRNFARIRPLWGKKYLDFFG